MTILRALPSSEADVEEPPVHLEIDTDASSAATSAETTVAHFGLVPEQPHERFPSL